jgi:hypothetical protein
MEIKEIVLVPVDTKLTPAIFRNYLRRDPRQNGRHHVLFNEYNNNILRSFLRKDPEQTKKFVLFFWEEGNSCTFLSLPQLVIQGYSSFVVKDLNGRRRVVIEYNETTKEFSTINRAKRKEIKDLHAKMRFIAGSK